MYFMCIIMCTCSYTSEHSIGYSIPPCERQKWSFLCEVLWNWHQSSRSERYLEFALPFQELWATFRRSSTKFHCSLNTQIPIKKKENSTVTCSCPPIHDQYCWCHWRMKAVSNGQNMLPISESKSFGKKCSENHWSKEAQTFGFGCEVSTYSGAYLSMKARTVFQKSHLVRQRMWVYIPLARLSGFWDPEHLSDWRSRLTWNEQWVGYKKGKLL